MNRYDALTGTLVADAASMGLHWLYDVDQIDALAACGDVLFRAPDAAVYADKRGAFVHGDRQAGQLSHYGESARLLGELVLHEPYTRLAHRQRFHQAFGPGGRFVGYADRPTKALIARMILDGDELTDPSGMDDNQMPALAVIPGLFAVSASTDTILDAAQVISVHEHVQQGARAVAHCLQLLVEGSAIRAALSASAEAADGDIGAGLRQALAHKDYEPVGIGETFGRACYVHHALPVVWHLLQHSVDFESVVRDNIRCGGDSCGRAMALGAIAGLAYGVPASLIQRVGRGELLARTT